MGWEADTTIDPGSDKGQSPQFVPRARKRLQHEVHVLLDSVKDTIQLLYTVWYLLNSIRKIEVYQDQQMCRRTRQFGGIDGIIKKSEVRLTLETSSRYKIAIGGKQKPKIKDEQERTVTA